MAVDLSDLMELPRPRKRRSRSTGTSEGSVAAIVDKATVLAMVDQLEAEATDESVQKQQVLAISHSENVTQWILAISRWLQAAPTGRIRFTQLCQSLGLSRVEVWLGVLLGGFELEQEEFYSDTLWVKRSSSGF